MSCAVDSWIRMDWDDMEQGPPKLFRSILLSMPEHKQRLLLGGAWKGVMSHVLVDVGVAGRVHASDRNGQDE